MLRYGTHMVGIGLAGALMANFDSILVGRFLGTSALGFYTLGFRVPELILSNFSFVVGRVALPILSHLQGDRGGLQATYLTYVRFATLFAFPAGAGIALTAHLLVPVFYTDKWLPSVLVMQILAIAMAVGPLGFLPGVLYKAINRPEILTRLAVIKVPVAALLLWQGTHWGIRGVAAGQLAALLFAALLDTLTVRHVLAISFRATGRALMPALLATLCMVAAVGATATIVEPQGWWGLLLLGAEGLVVYAGSLWLFARETWDRTWGMLQRLLKGSSIVEGA
jgi:PST family polysaccharide transporter